MVMVIVIMIKTTIMILAIMDIMIIMITLIILDYEYLTTIMLIITPSTAVKKMIKYYRNKNTNKEKIPASVAPKYSPHERLKAGPPGRIEGEVAKELHLSVRLGRRRRHIAGSRRSGVVAVVCEGLR